MSPERVGHPCRHKLKRRELFPRRATEKKHHCHSVGDIPSNKEHHPLFPKIHIPIGNPGMYPGCPLMTTDRTQKLSHRRPRTQKTKSIDPYTQNKSFSARTQKTRQVRPPVQRSSQFRSPYQNQVNFDPPTKTKLISTSHLNQVNFDHRSKIKSI